MVNTNAAANMTFEEFAKAYRAAFAKMLTYKHSEIGSEVYLAEMVALAEAHPEWAEEVENE